MRITRGRTTDRDSSVSGRRSRTTLVAVRRPSRSSMDPPKIASGRPSRRAPGSGLRETIQNSAVRSSLGRRSGHPPGSQPGSRRCLVSIGGWADAIDPESVVHDWSPDPPRDIPLIMSAIIAFEPGFDEVRARTPRGVSPSHTRRPDRVVRGFSFGRNKRRARTATSRTKRLSGSCGE